MSGKKSRNKGRAFEQELCRWFKSYGIGAKRGFQTRDGGSEQADVILAPLRLAHLHIEAKRPAKCSIYKYMEQAIEDIHQSEIVAGCKTPVVLLRADRKPALAVMLAEDWIEEVCIK